MSRRPARQPRRRPPLGMARSLRRVLGVCLLLIFAVLLAPGADAHGEEGHRHTHHDAPVCSLFCLDECATATLPQAPAAPPPDGLPRPDFAPERIPELISRAIEPEHAPPRA